MVHDVLLDTARRVRHKQAWFDPRKDPEGKFAGKSLDEFYPRFP